MRGQFWSGAIAAAMSLTAATAVADPSGPADARPTVPVPHDPRAGALLDGLPAAFERNRGQAPEEFDFLVRCRGYHAFVASTRVVFSFDGVGVALSLEGAARCEPVTRGLELPGRANYLLGNDPAKWITQVPTTRGAVYADATPGTSWTFGGRGRSLDFAFDLAPGMDGPRLRLDGADAVAVAEDGSLRIGLPHGTAKISAPVAWQDVAGTRVDARASWLLEKDGAVRIAVAARDPSRGIHIDPSVTYETYLGGNANEQAGAVALDASSAAYVVGETASTDFPTTSGAFSRTKQTDGTPAVRTDVFVSKISSSGTSVVYSTYVGGKSDDRAFGVVVDSSGNATFNGSTGSNDYPTTPGVYRFSSSSGGGILTKLNSTGSSLVFSTYTPVSSGYVALGAGGSYCVEEGGSGVACYSADGASQIYSVLLRPTSTYGGQGMAVSDLATDSSGNAYVVGSSDMQNYPATSGAYQTSYAGRKDAFVTKIDTTGAIVYTTYLGGSQDETGGGIAVNLAGQAYVVGVTQSTNFPVTSGAWRTTAAGAGEGFLTRFNASGSALRSSTYLGPIGAQTVRVHPGSSCVVVGATYTSGLTVSDGFQTSIGGGYDGYLLKFHRDNTLAWSSYFGGSGDDYVYRLGMGADGTIVAAGHTESTNLPTVSALQATMQTPYDLILVKVPDTLPTAIAPVVIDTDTLPTWTVGYAYTPPALSASGGIGPYVWTLVGGSLPPGAAMSSAGTFSGTLTQTGTYTIKVHVEDTCEIPAEKQFTIRVNPPPSISSPSMKAATIDTPYDNPVPVANGSGTMSFVITAGAAPPGTTLATDGRLVGAPSQLGDFPFTVKVTDGRGATGSGQVSLHVNQTPFVVADVIPEWTETRPYTVQFRAALGSGGFTWSLVSGTLPTSTPLDAALGRISGPAKSAGTYVYTLRATDAAGAPAVHTFTSKINALPRITSATLPTAAIGRPYLAHLAHSGGTPPYSWKIGEGMPPGLALDGTLGTIHGDLTGPAAGPTTLELTDKADAFTSGTVTVPSAEIADLTKKKWSLKVAIAEGSPDPVVRYLELTAGALLQIDVKGGGQIDAGPAAHLVDAGGTELDLSAWTRATTKSLSVRNAEIAATGRYFLTIVPAPESKGKLQVSVAIVPRASWKSGATVDPSAPVAYPFTATPGSRLTLSAKAAKGSAALPHVVSIVGPDGIDLVLGGRLAEKGSASVFTSKVPLAGGDYVVTFATRDATSGSFGWSVSLKAPKTYDLALTDVAAGD